MKISSEQRLFELLKARTPVVAFLTHEEGRACSSIQALVRRLPNPRPYYDWSATQGLMGPPQRPTGASPDVAKREVVENTKSIDDVLGWILGSKQPGVFVLKDTHHFFDSFLVLRLLRDAVQVLPTMGSESGKIIVLLSPPPLMVPPDLEKDVIQVDFDLPDAETIRKIFPEINEARVRARPPKAPLALPEEKLDRLVEASLGLTETEIYNASAVSLARRDDLDPEIIAFEKKTIVRRSGALDFIEADRGIADVGGLDILKDWVSKRRRAFTKEARDYKLPVPKGVLLLGCPGTGKSLVAKVIGSSWGRPTIRLDLGAVYGGLVGESEANIRNAIKTAEAVAPCILWCDELEKAVAGRGGDNDGGTSARVFGTLLTWMSEKTAPVFIVATANDVRALPPELLRKGRLDDIFFVDLPGPKSREEIFRIHLMRYGRDPERFDLEALSMTSQGYSGSEIEQALISSMYDAFDAGREVNPDDILRALQETLPLSETMKEQITYLRDWAKHRARPASSPEAETIDMGRVVDV